MTLKMCSLCSCRLLYNIAHCLRRENWKSCLPSQNKLLRVFQEDRERFGVYFVEQIRRLTLQYRIIRRANITVG